MVGRPQVLLFDEPLSNLDARLRVEMRNELRRIQRQIGLSSIYVTHDQAEALAISDWIVVMKDGRIVERGRPLDIYRYPRHVFTAQFLGTTNLIAGTVADVDAVTGRLGVTTRSAASSASIPSRTLATGRQGAGQHPAGGSVDAGAAGRRRGAGQCLRGHADLCDFRGRGGRSRATLRRDQAAMPARTAKPT